MTWLPTVSGRAIDLIDPVASQVNFDEEAHALAGINRYNGHGFIQCSVARHILIGLDLCPRELRPWWLLHDVHETRLGEITRPTLEALCEVARDFPARLGMDGGEFLQKVLGEFKARHDAAIHAAAGLPLPSAGQREQIAAIDHTCLATEHRDLHRPSARKWFHELAGILPGRNRVKTKAADKTGDELADAFRQYLPALRGVRVGDLLEG